MTVSLTVVGSIRTRKIINESIKLSFFLFSNKRTEGKCKRQGERSYGSPHHHRPRTRATPKELQVDCRPLKRFLEVFMSYRPGITVLGRLFHSCVTHRRKFLRNTQCLEHWSESAKRSVPLPFYLQFYLEHYHKTE